MNAAWKRVGAGSCQERWHPRRGNRATRPTALEARSSLSRSCRPGAPTPREPRLRCAESKTSAIRPTLPRNHASCWRRQSRAPGCRRSVASKYTRKLVLKIFTSSTLIISSSRSPTGRRPTRSAYACFAEGMPVGSVGLLTTRSAVSAGPRILSRSCTASKSDAATIGGTEISTTSASGLRSRVFQNFVLKRWRPMYVVRSAPCGRRRDPCVPRRG